MTAADLRLPATTGPCAKAMVRLSAGRGGMSDEMEALCLLEGANSIFVGGRLLTTANPGRDADAALFALLALRPMALKRGPRNPTLSAAVP